MRQSLTDLLNEAEPIFRRIGEYEASPESLPEVLELIDKYEPPASWVLELPSQLKEGTYKTLPIDLMEAAVRRIFGYTSGMSKTLHTSITQDRMGKFSVSKTVEYTLKGYYGTHVLIGTASVTSPNIQGLELADPKASSMAVKSAIRQLGGLFGRYLNREEEQEIIEAPKENLEEKMESLPETLKKVETLEELKSYRKLVYSKSVSHEIQAIYEEKFRELKAKNTSK